MIPRKLVELECYYTLWQKWEHLDKIFKKSMLKKYLYNAVCKRNKTQIWPLPQLRGEDQEGPPPPYPVCFIFMRLSGEISRVRPDKVFCTIKLGQVMEKNYLVIFHALYIIIFCCYFGGSLPALLKIFSGKQTNWGRLAISVLNVQPEWQGKKFQQKCFQK